MYPRRSTVGSTLGSRTRFLHLHLETLGASAHRTSKHSSHHTWPGPSPRRVWIGTSAQVSCVGINYDRRYGGDRLVQWNCNLSGPSSILCGRELETARWEFDKLTSSASI